MPHLLLFANHMGTRLELQQQFAQEGFTWELPEFADISMDRLQQAAFDAAFIDLNPVFGDGARFLRVLRACPNFQMLPALVLANSFEDLEKILLLDAGADDYAIRPISMRELVARLQALLRRSSCLRQNAPAPALQWAALQVDLGEQEAHWEGRRLDLTRREFELLAYFVQHPHQVLSREKLLQQVWGLTYLGESRTIDAHVRRLRAKLQNAASLVETVVGVGYRFGSPESAKQAPT